MKRSDNITWSQVKVGIFIVVALIFLALGILLMGKQTKLFTSTGAVSVLMSDVAGLKVGAPVWLAGIDVGVVTGIGFKDPRKSNEVKIEMDVDREALHKIGADSVISVKTRGLMGEKYVDITPSSSYVAKPPEALRGIPTAKLDDVMQKAGKTFDTLNGIVEKVNRGEGSLGRFANDPKLYDNLETLTRELNVFAKNVNSGQGTIGRLTRSSEPYDRMMSILNRAERTLVDLESSDGTLSRLIHDRTFYDKLVSLADKSEKAADEVRELNRKLVSKEGTIGMLLTDRGAYDKGIALMARAENSLKAVEEITARVDRGEGTAGKLLTDKELYDRLNRAVESLDALVKDVKENPKRYLKFSVF
jgi:phospholipid/cholesterol/gamma-HCH transport system substrate-binding protein